MRIIRGQLLQQGGINNYRLLRPNHVGRLAHWLRHARCRSWRWNRLRGRRGSPDQLSCRGMRDEEHNDCGEIDASENVAHALASHVGIDSAQPSRQPACFISLRRRITNAHRENFACRVGKRAGNKTPCRTEIRYGPGADKSGIGSFAESLESFSESMIAD